MNWKDEFIERFCDVHKPSNPWQPTSYKWTLFKTTETEDVFVFIESLLKKERIDEKCLQAIKSSQNILAKWIVPDSGISDNDCLTELLGILDDKGLVKYISELEGGSE